MEGKKNIEIPSRNLYFIKKMDLSFWSYIFNDSLLLLLVITHILPPKEGLPTCKLIKMEIDLIGLYFIDLEKSEGTETHLPYTFRLSTAKILLDLEEYDTATKVYIQPFIHSLNHLKIHSCFHSFMHIFHFRFLSLWLRRTMKWCQPGTCSAGRTT